MRFRATSLFVLPAMCLLAAPALRAADKPAAPPSPAPEMAQLAYFAGTWACSGKAFASPMGPEHPTEGSVYATRGLGGFWYVVHYDEKKTDLNPTPYHAALFMGYDATQQTFVEHCYDSLGGYCSQTSEGWSGDVLAFEGSALGMGPPTSSRDIFTKKGATRMVHSGEMQGADGTWMKIDEETCTRVAAKK